MADITEFQRISDAPPAAPSSPSASSETPFAIAYGTTRHSIDSTGRFVIPANFIKEFGTSYYMTLDEEDRIVVFPADRFRDLGKVLTYKRSDEYEKDDIAYAVDRIFAFAEFVKTDPSGRVGFSETFRETLLEARSGLDKEIPPVPTGSVFFVGALDRILILTEMEFRDYRKSHLKSRGGVYKHGQLMRMTYATYGKSGQPTQPPNAAGGAQ